MKNIENHVCKLYLDKFENSASFSEIIADIAASKFKRCKLNKDYLGTPGQNLSTIMLNAVYAIKKFIEKV
jgi:hypothetical protein